VLKTAATVILSFTFQIHLVLAIYADSAAKILVFLFILQNTGDYQLK